MSNLPRGLVTVVAALFLILVGSGTWFYRAQRQQVLRDAKADLESIAQLKADQLRQWRNERLSDAAVLMDNTLIADTAERWLAYPQQRDTGEKRILAQFRLLQKHHRFHDVLLVDPEGQVRLSLSGQTEPLPPATVAIVAGSLRTQQPALTDLHLSAGDAAPRLEVVVPLQTSKAATNRIVGAVLLQIDAREFLYQVTQSWPTPSRTAETLFVRREGDDVLFLNAVRNQPDAALRLRIPLTRVETPSVMAVQGRRGVVEGVDYGGVKVLAALKEIPDSPWLMVTKMETAEALAEWRFRAILIIAVLLLLLGLLAGNLVIVWQQRSKYQVLSRSAEILRQSEQRVRERTQELEESEERFRKLFADSGEATLLIENGRFIDCNRATLAALRMVAREQVRNLHPDQISPECQPDGERSATKAEAMMALAFEKGSHRFEWEHLRANGERFLAEVLLTPIYYRNRRLLHAVWRDITEQRKSEALRTQLSAIIESTSDFVATASPEGRVTYYNRVAREMFGLGPTDDPASMTIARSHPAWAAKLVLEEGIPTAIRDGIWTGETAFLSHEGLEIPHTQVIIAHRAADGSVELISTVARDISEQKAAEALVKARLRLMELAQTRPLEEFLQGTLDVIEAHTGSTIGFYHFMDADQEHLSLQAWSTNTLRHMCTAEGKGRHYPISQAGVWCDCVRARQPVIHNDYLSLPHRQGLPPGHSPITRQAVVPILRRNRIVAIIGGGNKPSPYGPAEVEMVNLLGDFSWEIVERKRVEQSLRNEELLFHTFMDKVPDRVFFKDLEGRFLRVNRSKLARHGFTEMAEIIGKTDFDLETEEAARASRRDEEDIIRTGQPLIDREELVAYADGIQRWSSAHKLPFRDATGRIVGIFGISRDITERKQFERKLQDTAQRLQMLWQSVENSPASVVMTDTQGKIEYVNPKFIEVTGYARKEVLGQNPRVLKSGQTPDRVYADMWCTLASGQNWLGELCNRRKDGSLFWESAILSPVKNEAGAVVSYLAIKEDITAKKLAQQDAAREAARQMQQKEIITRLAVTPALTEGRVEQVACELTELVGRAFGIARVGVWLFNEDETRLQCVDLYDAGSHTHSADGVLDEAQFHNEFEALKHANYIDAHDPLTDPRTAGYVETYLKPTGITSMLDAVVRAGGRNLGVVCLEQVNQPHRWEPDEIAFTCQLADQINLTLLNRDRRRAEQALQHSFSLLQATLQSTADGILVVDRTGKITSFNDRFAELWRIPAAILNTQDDAAALNHILVQLKHPETFAVRVNEVYAAPERDSFDVIEFLDGRVFERHSRPQFVQGQPVGRVWSFRDVTPQRHAEAEQMKLLADLERSNKELEQFAYVASHDLQEPLRLVSSYTQLLLQRYRDRLDAGADPLVSFITEGVTRMQRLIQDLLAYSRVSSRSTPFARMDATQPLTIALQNLTLALREQQAVVTHDPLPELLGDETQMIQLFQNLIGNALKFRRPDEPPRVHVGVRPADEGDAWLFSVQDNGIGIAPEYYERIFVIFQRLHSRKKYAGTGIGLAICKRIVERHGGRIWVESPNGGGTIFCFTMPTVAA